MPNSPKRSKHELRCVCKFKPLLAVYGVDNGELYIHVKIYKAKRLYAEVVVTEGKIKIHCRDCHRWHKIRLVTHERAVLVEDKMPSFLSPG